MGALISLVVVGLLTTGVVFLIYRSLKKQASASIGQEREILRQEIEKYDAAIERAIAALNEMVSFDEQSKIEAEQQKLKQSLEQETAKVKKLEKELESLQQRVDKQEMIHNELKKGKEDSDKFAIELKQSKDRVQTENNELAAGMEAGLAQLTASFGGGKLDPAQVTTLKALETAMKLTAGSLKEFSEIYARGSLRYVNLERQYEELEREFRKLVDKALAGEEVDDEEAPAES